MTDIEQGREALRYFHNASVSYQGYEPDSLDELVNLYGKKRDIYLDGVGMVIRETGLNAHQVQDAMLKLAAKAQGKIPKDHQGYINALANKAGQINYLDLSKVVVTEVFTQVGDGAAAVGNSIVTTGSILTKVLPFLAIAAVVVFVFSHATSSETKKAIIDKVKKRIRKKKAA